MYYIETSVGKIEFQSELDNCSITLEKGDYGKPVYHGIEPQNSELFNKFLDLYNFYRIYVVGSVNGLFLKIELLDGFYGSPEYKIYRE